MHRHPMDRSPRVTKLSSRGQNVWCTRCGGEEFTDFGRTENGRATAVCAGCGDRVLIFGARLLDLP